MPPFLCSASLTPVPHGFFGREGGHSTGLYTSLNVGIGSSDDPDLVQRNRTAARNALAPTATLVTVRQVHSARVVTVTAPLVDADRPEADALVTAHPGLLLGILTADCAPVLFADPNSGIVGAAHAGWRGALDGILANTVAAMVALGARARDIRAAVGPCIARRSYEVDSAFKDRFTTVSPAHDAFFSEGTRAGHHQFDLEGFVAHQLAAAGLAHIDLLGEDTATQPDRYFSYRRATLAGETDYGRQLSAILQP